MKRNNKFLVFLLIIALFSLAVFVSFKRQKQLNEDATPQQNSEDQIIGEWEVLSIKENGTQIVSKTNNATIIFFVDGTCSANGGCNEMMNCQYKIFSDSKLSITVGGTKRGCSQDVVEYWDLNEVASYKRIDDILHLYYEKENGVSGFFEFRKSKIKNNNIIKSQSSRLNILFTILIILVMILAIDSFVVPSRKLKSLST